MSSGKPFMQMTGVIKNYGSQKGFGFIMCEQVGGDIYFQGRELPAETLQLYEQGTFELRGCTVKFQLNYAPDGKPQARNVSITELSGQDGKGPQPYSGEVRSYNEQKGYGFLTCAQLGSDIYFRKREVPAALQGKNISGMKASFDTHKLPDGKLQATRVRFDGVPMAAPLDQQVEAAAQEVLLQQYQLHVLQHQQQMLLLQQQALVGAAGLGDAAGGSAPDLSSFGGYGSLAALSGLGGVGVGASGDLAATLAAYNAAIGVSAGGTGASVTAADDAAAAPAAAAATSDSAAGLASLPGAPASCSAVPVGMPTLPAPPAPPLGSSLSSPPGSACTGGCSGVAAGDVGACGGGLTRGCAGSSTGPDLPSGGGLVSGSSVARTCFGGGCGEGAGGCSGGACGSSGSGSNSGCGGACCGGSSGVCNGSCGGGCGGSGALESFRAGPAVVNGSFDRGFNAASSSAAPPGPVAGLQSFGVQGSKGAKGDGKGGPAGVGSTGFDGGCGNILALPGSSLGAGGSSIVGGSSLVGGSNLDARSHESSACGSCQGSSSKASTPPPPPPQGIKRTFDGGGAVPPPPLPPPPSAPPPRPAPGASPGAASGAPASPIDVGDAAGKRSKVGGAGQRAPMDGIIRSYNGRKGFGFISCQAVGVSDIYFKKTMLPEHMQETDLNGAAVRFTLNYTSDGKPQAAKIEV